MFSAFGGGKSKFAVQIRKIAARILSRPLLALSILFIWIAATRIFFVALHDPMLGYGNQFDMGRTAACVNLWPDSPAGPQDIAYFDAPVTKHLRVSIPSQSCYPSAEVLLDILAIKLDSVRTYFSSDTRFDMRAIGLLKAVLLILVACVANDALRQSPRIAVFHALIFVLVLADPIVTLYLNTLYGEFIAVFGAYAAFAGLVALTLTRRLTPAATMLIASGIGFLAFSRMQHVLLPMIFIGWLAIVQLKGTAPASWFREYRGTCVLMTFAVTVALVGVFGNLRFMTQNPIFHEVNRNNVLFGALLPATANPRVSLAALGLPPECRVLIHSDFFRKALRGLNGACPEALTITHVQMLSMIAKEPAAFATVFGRGVMLASAWRMPYVGEVASASFMRASRGPLGIATSFESVSRKMSYMSQLIFWVVPSIGGLIAGFSILLRGRRAAAVTGDSISVLGAAAVLVLSLIVVSAWTTSLFGDGYSELARHLHLGLVSALASWVILAGLFILYRPLWIGVLTSGISAICVAYLCTLPVGLGRLSEPASDAKFASGSEFSGWVIAPYVVVAIDIEQNGRRLYRANAMPSQIHARLHPFNAGQNAFYFAFNSTSIPASFEAGVPIEVYAEDANSRRELVDVRYW